MNFEEITVMDLDMKKTIKAMQQIFEQYRVRRFIVGEQKRDKFASGIFEAVSRLPEQERILITERYLKSSYVLDYQVYNFKLESPISKDTYVKRRRSAIFKLALAFHDMGILNIDHLLKRCKEVPNEG